jgi:2-desacetyl-2-hydroxyethyl bacteriochlorophyllide A dehydrogenase
MDLMHVPVFKGQGQLKFEDRPLPYPQGPNDVLIKIDACGICGTDLNILSVPAAHTASPDIIIGHEAIGDIAEVGQDVTNLQPGDRVVIAPRITCGKCYYCRRGLDNQCNNYRTIGTTIDGAFAPYLRAPGSAVYKIDSDVPRDDAVFFEPLSCVVGSVARTPVQTGDTIVIIGAGPMGLLFALMYHTLGAEKIIAVDIASHRLDFAKGMGVNEVINPTEVDPATAVEKIAGYGADIVVDAVGNQIQTAMKLVRRGGHIILFGLRPQDKQTINQYGITRYDLTVHGTFVGLNPFKQTLELLESGRIQPSRLITHRIPLSELAQGVALMRSGIGMKIIVEN